MKDIKRPRLVEESMPYEALATAQICSDDEVPLSCYRDFNTLKKEQKMVKKANFLKEQIKDLKMLTMTGMRSILESIQLMD